jgi:hypothetical protein
MPKALPRACISTQTTRIIASEAGSSIAAPTPVSARPPISTGMDGAAAQSRDAATNTTAPAMKTSRRPKISANSPPVSNRTP